MSASIVPRAQESARSIPTFRVGGPTDLTRDLEDRSFQQALGELLFEAGFIGTFTIVGMRTVKGTPHTKGLRIHSPSFKGAMLTWHTGSNDRNVLFLIPTPMSIVKDRMDFHEKLTAALKRIDDRKTAEVPEKRETVVEPPRAETPVSAPEPAPEVATPPQAQSAKGTCTVDDAAAELLIERLLDRATPEGLVARRNIRDVLVMLDYKSELMGPTFRSLIAGAHFEHSDSDDFLRIGLRWRQKYLPASVSPPEEVPPPPVTVMGPVEPVPVAEAAEEAPKPVRAKEQDPRIKLARLLRFANEAAGHRKRLLEITDERKKVEEIAAVYAARIHDLDAEATRLTGALQSPDLQNAEERLKSVKDQLNF